MNEISMDLVTHCSKTQFCTDCSRRKGCAIRSTFYNENFEIILQFSEIFSVSKLNISSSSAYIASNSFRAKRNRELNINPSFSYD